MIRLLTALLLVSTPFHAGTVSLEWEPVSYEGQIGYRVYWGAATGVYPAQFETGLDPQMTLSGLADCKPHFIAVKALSKDGQESAEFSNEVSGWARPESQSVAPASLEADSAGRLTIDGINFQPGATVEFTDPAIVVTHAIVESCTRLLVDVTVGPEASIGTSSFAVVNPDQVFGAGIGLFAVTVPTDVAPPVISAATAEAVESTTAKITWITDEPAEGQVLYRVRTRPDYQAAPVEESMVTQHSAMLTGLKPSTDYRFYVTSADSAGNISTSAEVSFETEPNDSSYLTFEAELPTIEAPLETGTDNDAFQGEWLGLAAESPAGTSSWPSGIADYSFHAPTAGTWTVWIRVFAPHPAADTLFASVDGAALEAVVARQVGVWHWVEGSNYALSAGQHTLALGGATAETRADRILITDDTDFLPTEQPERNTLPPDRASGLTATTSATSVHLGWKLSSHPDVRRVIVRYRADGTFPTNAVDGLPLVDEPSSAGAVGLLIHEDLAPGTTLHYAVFAVDGAGNVSLPATLFATTANSSTGGAPPPPPDEDSSSGETVVFRYSAGGL